MKKAFQILLIALLVIFAMACAALAWRLFAGIHFFVADAVGDAREMRGDGPQTSYWRDFVGYLCFYLLPAFIVGCAALATAFAVSIARRLNG